MEKTEYNIRYVARIIMEAATPIKVGNGEKNIMTDAEVATDVNGLPYIPGTTLAGVIRNTLKTEKISVFWGYQDRDKGRGSEIIFTDAKMIDGDGNVIEGIQKIDWSNDFYRHYKALPIRQHVRIDHKGVADKAGKFDEQIVIKGTRFCFEIEAVSKDEKNKESFENALKALKSATFRIGGGTRKGFGEMKIISITKRAYDFCNPNDLDDYINKSSSLNADFDGSLFAVSDDSDSQWIKYELTLRPDSFFLFGSGFGDDEADMTPVKSKYVKWDSNKGTIEENAILIPSTSLKGAIAHRTAYHYNKQNNRFAEDEELETYLSNNVSIKDLFGIAGKGSDDIRRGNVIFSDIIEKAEVSDKILNHVAIDRFTGGAIEGALFSEKATYAKGKEFSTTIYVNESCKEHLVYLEEALKDICKGLLPLGGGVGRGNGIFCGKVEKEKEVLIDIKEI